MFSLSDLFFDRPEELRLAEDILFRRHDYQGRASNQGRAWKLTKSHTHVGVKQKHQSW